MSYYEEILAVQPPFDIGPDNVKRPTFSVNFDCRVTGYTGKLEQEICSYIAVNNLGQLPPVGTTLWYGRSAPIPTGDGPIIHLFNTGGSSTDETHDDRDTFNLSFQIVVRALKYDDARQRVWAIWRLLDGLREIEIESS
jgi:hypothetical protein